MKRVLFGITLLAMGFLAGSCIEDEEYTQGVWMRRSDFDGVARSGASSFTIGDKGYICCGYRGSNKTYLKDLWMYNIAGDYWTQCADMPDEAEGRHSATSFTLDGKGYITTGAIREEPKYLADTWQYNPDTNSWQRMDDFAGGMRYGALGFSVGGYGYVGTGNNDNYLKDFYRFNPAAPAGSQWSIVNGFGGYKRLYGTAFVINDVAYIGFGQNNSVAVIDFWKFDGNTWTQLRDIANSNEDEDYDDEYGDIARYSTVSFVINGKGYIATGNRSGVSSDYWMYNPSEDLWYGDSDDDFTPLTEVHNGTGGSSRSDAVSFSTGTRGFVLTGASGSSYFDDIYELLPDEEEDV